MIRNYLDTDFELCNSMLLENMKAYFERYESSWDQTRFRLNLQKGITRVLEEKGQILGFFHLGTKEEQGYVHTIQVAREARGRGLGTRLIQEIESICWAKNYRIIRLRVYPENPAVVLYEKLGYEVIDKQSTKLLMQKKLRD